MIRIQIPSDQFILREKCFYWQNSTRSDSDALRVKLQHTTAHTAAFGTLFSQLSKRHMMSRALEHSTESSPVPADKFSNVSSIVVYIKKINSELTFANFDLYPGLQAMHPARDG